MADVPSVSWGMPRGFSALQNNLLPVPSALALHAQDDLSLQKQWTINGTHYSRTLEDWLVRQDRQRARVMPIMKVPPAPAPPSLSQHTRLQA